MATSMNSYAPVARRATLPTGTSLKGKLHLVPHYPYFRARIINLPPRARPRTARRSPRVIPLLPIIFALTLNIICDHFLRAHIHLFPRYRISRRRRELGLIRPESISKPPPPPPTPTGPARGLIVIT